MPTEHATIDRARCAKLAQFYRRYLLDDILAFWEARTNDPEYPGYLVMFDREGHCTGTDKYIWCQGRQTWMFAALYNHLEKRDNWLELARTGRDLLVNHAHAGGGRFHYRLNRDGSVKEAARSLFTDAFALIGLCEYAVASGSDEDLPLIRETFDAMQRHYQEPGFSEYHHFDIDPALHYHGPRMVGVGMASVLRPVLGAERVDAFAETCLNQVLWDFAKDEHQVLFEVLDGEGQVLDTPGGQTINPGHALESMWFCLEEALYRDDQRAVDRAVQVTEWAYENGVDREQGGILAFTSPQGERPASADEPNPFGETWDSKIWWVHSESALHPGADRAAQRRHRDVAALPRSTRILAAHLRGPAIWRVVQVPQPRRHTTRGRQRHVDQVGVSHAAPLMKLVLLLERESF